MALQHGNKIYLQVLLDPARGLILQQIAKDKGLKTTALARQAIYDWLALMTEEHVIKAAEALDKARWQQSVQNRIDGRKRKRQQRILNQIAS